MNFIVVCIDSLRTDHMGCYGNSWIRTPNFDRFFEKSIIFDGFKMNAIPTIPFRRGFMLGRDIFPFKDQMFIPGVSKIMGWQPMEHDELTIQQVLQGAGYVTGMVTDVYHYFWPAYNFHKGFDSWQFIRGQESDTYITGDIDLDADHFINQDLEGTKVLSLLEQYFRNVGKRKSEADCFAAQVFTTAEKWLEDNALLYEDWYLYIDCFDPHEPWDPPREYVDLYDPGYKGKEIIFPMNGINKHLTQEEITHIRALYAAEVTMVDRWFGHLMEKFYNMGLEKDTAVLFITDHGVGLGEHGIWKKTPLVLYPELLDPPMMLMLPGKDQKHERIKGFVQESDIAPTILKQLGMDVPETMKGLDFWPLITGEKDAIRDYAVGGYHNHAYVRDHEYHYFRNLKKGDENPCLFDLEKDPGMNSNIVKEQADVVKTMEDRLIRALDGWTLPETLGKSVAQLPYTPVGKKRTG
ncbi:MAG: sulfatase [Deltaproteobacteria bacterium]|nr:sulfatase [Deltaproteobacteria bacterium]